MNLAWIGLWLSLNANTAIVKSPTPVPAAEATAVFNVGKLSVTSVFVQPLQRDQPRIASFGVGVRVF